MKLFATARRDSRRQLIWVLASLAGAMAAAGCSSTHTDSGGPPPPPPPAAEFIGTIRSGTSPVTGAAISFYAAGASGPGAGASNLLPGDKITSDATGAFSVPVFTCPSSTTQVYLVGRGGSTAGASGTENSALVMMAALGDCGSIDKSTVVVINEVS